MLNERGQESKKRLDMVFRSVDFLKADLNLCGVNLSEAKDYIDFQLIRFESNQLTIIWGVQAFDLMIPVSKGDNLVSVVGNGNFSKGSNVLIYNPDEKTSQLQTALLVDGSEILLDAEINRDFPLSSKLIQLKQVVYEFKEKNHELKRRVNGGSFKTLLDEATFFNIKYFPETQSVLYRIEMGNKEMVRGYVNLYFLQAQGIQ